MIRQSQTDSHFVFGRASMAPPRLLLSPSAASKMVILKKWPLRVCFDRTEARHYSHQLAAADFSESQHDHLQSTVEGVMSVVGGKMVVADMQFTRDSFEYWRNAVIPSSSLVKGLASTWASTGADGANPDVHFKFHAEQTLGKRTEAFLQKMVADVEQRIVAKGSDPLQNRRLDVRLADEQELLTEKEKQEPRQVFKQTLGDMESVVLPELQTPETKHRSSIADEQGSTIVEEKCEAEHGTVDVQDLMTKEDTSEAMHELIRQLVMQSIHEQAVAVTQEKSEAKQELVRGLEAQSTDGQYLIVKEQKTKAEQGLNRQLDVQEVRSKDLKKPKVTEELNKRLADVLSMNEKQGAELREGEGKYQHKEEEVSERKHGRLVADIEQKAMEKQTKSEATQGFQGEEGAETRRAVQAEKQNYGMVKDFQQQQTDNIVKTTRRMGKKIVHIYYDKSAASGRVSLYR